MNSEFIRSISGSDDSNRELKLITDIYFKEQKIRDNNNRIKKLEKENEILRIDMQNLKLQLQCYCQHEYKSQQKVLIANENGSTMTICKKCDFVEYYPSSSPTSRKRTSSYSSKSNLLTSRV